MIKATLTGQRLVALFLLGWVLVNYPILSVFDVDRVWLGIPAIYLYVFGVWAAVIALMAVERFWFAQEPPTAAPATAAATAAAAQTAAAILGHNFRSTEWYEDSYRLLTAKGLEPKARGDSWLARVYRQVIRGEWL